MSQNRQPGYLFFLGGQDLEMQTIRALLQYSAPPDRIVDHGLGWGARASAYRAELKRATAHGQVPVLIELNPDIPLPPGTIEIDHHGVRAGAERPTSLEQVFRLLGLPDDRWTRWHALVSANDRGYIPALQAIGASREEIQRIRLADRAAQGVTEQEEEQATQAVERAEQHARGRLTVVHLPHDRTSPATDRLEPTLGGHGYRNLLICTPVAVHFFGTGGLIDQLRAGFPSGWWGGALPERGFWGNHCACHEVLAFLEQALDREFLSSCQ